MRVVITDPLERSVVLKSARYNRRPRLSFFSFFLLFLIGVKFGGRKLMAGQNPQLENSTGDTTHKSNTSRLQKKMIDPLACS